MVPSLSSIRLSFVQTDLFFAVAECTVSYSTELKGSIRAFAGWLKRTTSLIKKQTGHGAAAMNFRSVRNSLATVAILFFATGCDNNGAVAQGSPQGRPPTEVGVVTLQPQSVDIATELPGRTTAARLAEVRPQVNGIILKRLFTEGAEVKAGSNSTRSIPLLIRLPWIPRRRNWRGRRRPPIRRGPRRRAIATF